jgi:beta-N-acetylhexosaminidase
MTIDASGPVLSDPCISTDLRMSSVLTSTTAPAPPAGTKAHSVWASLSAAPFHLDAQALQAVGHWFTGMDLDAKLRQLFALAFIGDDERDADQVAAFRPGAVVRAHGPHADVSRAATRRAVAGARVPLLVAADTEGGRNHPACLPAAPNALSLAAADDVALSAAVARQIARDAQQLGLNWSLGPTLDISAEFRSAIVGTRSFGSDVDRIERHALAQVAALQAEGMGATLKHWPGDGQDGRDQHLCTSVNPLSFDAWQATHGRIYRHLINAGALSVLVGHIAFPAGVCRSTPEAGARAFLPATACKEVTLDLLRGEYGFNGLVVTDALPMAGFSSAVSDEDRPVMALLAGCDMLLFSPDAAGDLARLHQAVQAGALGLQRVDEAVLRILGFKAALGLHRSQSDPAAKTSHEAADAARADLYSQVAQASVTRVKDVRAVLPLVAGTHPRLLLLVQQPVQRTPADRDVDLAPFVDELALHGFKATQLQPGEDLHAAVARVDALVYVLLQESLLTVGHIGIDWQQLHGGFVAAMARPWRAKPTVLVSFGHPYYLHDAPAMPCVVNAYVANEHAQRAAAACLAGAAPFKGISPVDPHAGQAQSRY